MAFLPESATLGLVRLSGFFFIFAVKEYVLYFIVHAAYSLPDFSTSWKSSTAS